MKILLDKLELTDDLLTGIDEIDDQHRELIDRVNSMFDAMIEGRSFSEVVSLIKFMVDYVVDHFNIEAKLMNLYTYPDMDRHLSEHSIFKRKIDKVMKKFEISGVSKKLIVELQHMLNSWLLDHMLGEDAKFARFVQLSGNEK